MIPSALFIDFLRRRRCHGVNNKRSHAILGTLMLVCQPSVAEPYATISADVRVGTSVFYVNTAGEPRFHDFATTGAFADRRTGVPQLATILAAAGPNQNVLLSGSAIDNAGIPGRVSWTPSAVVMRNAVGEGESGKPCRTQAASYQVAPDTPLRWSLRFSLGEKSAGYPWPLLPTGQDPVLLWQLKAPGLQPALAMIVDTDATDPSRVTLFFSQRAGVDPKVQRVGSIEHLSIDDPIDVRIDAVLDEREIAAGGRGYWHVWVNGILVVARVGPSISAFAKQPHQWFFGMYRYQTTCPSVTYRTIRWEKLLLEPMDPK
jgi:hypothetical protein